MALAFCGVRLAGAGFEGFTLYADSAYKDLGGYRDSLGVKEKLRTDAIVAGWRGECSPCSVVRCCVLCFCIVLCCALCFYACVLLCQTLHFGDNSH